MRTSTIAAVLTLSSLLWSARAEARHVRFVGAHPVAAKFGGGFCYIDSPHLHPYTPDRSGLYQQVNDQYVFTGDPTPFGYEGDKHVFYGHHPVASVGVDPVYCFIDGPHYHPFEAPDDDKLYKRKDGVAFYIGPYTPGYARIKPQRVRAVNAEYRPYATYRPTVEVAPPPEWHGEVYVATPSVTVQTPGVMVNAPPPRAQVVVNAPAPPSVYVEAPPPHVVVTAPRPGVVVSAPAPHIVVAPPRPHVVVGAPAPHVIVGAPAPHVIVGAPAPHVVVGAPAPGVVVVKGKHHKVHHDNGKHKGWYK